MTLLSIRRRAAVGVVSIGLLALVAGPISAEQPAAKRMPGVDGPTMLPPIKPAVFNGDLRRLPHGTVSARSERPELGQPRLIGRAVQTAGKPDPAAQTAAPTAVAPAAASFVGLDHAAWGAGWPPDANGDVGPVYYIQAVNTSIGIFRKSDGFRLAVFTFDDFFASTGTACDTSNQGDPVVLYDPLADRWIISDMAWVNFNSGPFYECLAVSQTGDPVAGGWRFYAVETDPGAHVPDYPKLGLWPDAIYMSANVFASTGDMQFLNVRVWAFNRSDLEHEKPLRAMSFDLPQSIGRVPIFSLLPSNLRGARPPGDRPNLFASIWEAKVAHVWKFHADWSRPSASSLSGPWDVTLSTWNIAPATVPEQSPGNPVDSLQERLMMQNQYRNLGGSESLWLAHTVANASGIASVRWYQLNVTGGSVTTNGPIQQATWSPDSSGRFMPSLAVDGSGDMALGYSVSSSLMRPSIRYAGRLVTDPLNTLGQGEATMIVGTGVQTNQCPQGTPCERWGDYSAMSIDPTDDCTFWYTNEFYATNGGDWQTRIGSFKFASCTGPPPPSPIPTPRG